MNENTTIVDTGVLKATKNYVCTVFKLYTSLQHQKTTVDREIPINTIICIAHRNVITIREIRINTEFLDIRIQKWHILWI